MEQQESFPKNDYHALTYTVPAKWAGRTVKSLLRDELKLSTTRVRALKKIQGIRLNGEPVRVTEILAAGDLLELDFVPVEQFITPEKMTLDIVYEDADLVVVNKPAGLLVHPVRSYQSGTLANGLVGLWQERGENATFHPLHRLDRLTTGLVVVAKHPISHQQLALQLENGGVHRLYLAVVPGNPPNRGKISAPIQSGVREGEWGVSAEGRSATTRYRRIWQGRNVALLGVRIYTGRTHQIRIHLAYAGFPLWGDPLYGEIDPDFPRPALHSVRLVFRHPRTGLRLKLETKMASDMEELTKRVW